MLTISVLKEKHHFEKFHKIITGNFSDADKLANNEKAYLFHKFSLRIRDWQNMLTKVETADSEKAFDYSVQWLRFMEYEKPVVKIYHELPHTFTEDKNYYKHHPVVFPHLAVITFSNKLSKLFEHGELWQRALPLIYNFINRVYFYDKENIFSYLSENDSKEFENIYRNSFHYPFINLLDRFALCVAESMYYACGGYDMLDTFELNGYMNTAKFFEGFELMRKAIDVGFSYMKFNQDKAGIYTIEKVNLDSNNRLHSENGPAIQFSPDEKGYYYHGVRVDERIIMHPETLTYDDIINATHRGVKEAMIAKIGLKELV
ncbi:hypothetical protein [Ignavibacterium sp.]|uniref:hypothetical protein n=1 Tax=Ignavibacterium sp. TaxID=2651167 RepID=UPI00307EC3FF